MFDKKLALMYMIEIFQNKTDQDHLLTQKDIIDILDSEYNVSLERKTVGSNIELLINNDFDIVKNPTGGYYLNERKFTESEIKFLVDAVWSSKNIAAHQAKEISEKLNSYLSDYQKKIYGNIYKTTEFNKSSNNELFLNIELINEAISKDKKICFNYLTYDKTGKLIERKNGRKYFLSPYYLINNSTKYYVLGAYKYNPKSAHFRIDLMRNVEVLDEARRPITDVESLGSNFNINKYLNEHIYMFSGDVSLSTIEILNPDNIDHPEGITYVKDWFGGNATIYEQDGKTYAKIKSNENAFFYWALQYQEHIKVLEPTSMVNRIVDSLKQNLNKYL